MQRVSKGPSVFVFRWGESVVTFDQTSMVGGWAEKSDGARVIC